MHDYGIDWLAEFEKYFSILACSPLSLSLYLSLSLSQDDSGSLTSGSAVDLGEGLEGEEEEEEEEGEERREDGLADSDSASDF